MKLSELAKRVKELEKKAKKAKVDPEVKVVVSPSFPILSTLRPEVLSSLDGGLDKELIGGEHIVYLAEWREEGDLFGEVVEKFDLI